MTEVVKTWRVYLISKMISAEYEYFINKCVEKKRNVKFIDTIAGLKIDENANRISLSHRDTLEHPWKGIDTQFAVNDIVKGTVTKIADFGAFVKIAPGIEGLVHISELAYQRVAKVSNVVKEGQELEVKIQSIDPQSQKLSLSHKACLAPPAPKQSAGKKDAVEAVEEPARDLAVPVKGPCARRVRASREGC